MAAATTATTITPSKKRQKPRGRLIPPGFILESTFSLAIQEFCSLRASKSHRNLQVILRKSPRKPMKPVWTVRLSDRRTILNSH
ncbi:hypothetical protein RRG08_062273 [Elysia crispata]|uniref:Uncharacterized protein n=1 Tax=Elysia crispata TaxID=231223 RepID=A0AAE0YG20_9GAST|nr:hypothetical protein RRG08_062273 [Elysia crispata]